MFKDVGYANNSKSTDHHRSRLTFLLKEQNHYGNLQIALWILITDLPPVNGYDSILVMVDQGLSKGVILVSCNKTLTSEDTARLLLENLYKQFGLLDKIISDRGPQFASKAFIKILKLLGIKSALSTAYHPQTNGTTKRVNQEIKAYLSIYCASHPEKLYTPWNSHITTDDMPTGRTPHLNLCLGNPR